MIADFLSQYAAIIIFYVIIIIFLIILRKKIDVQAKIIFLYRTKWGLRWMDKYAEKFRPWIILWGYIGVGIGFIGMILISVILVKNVIDLLIKPTATAGVSLVLPGVNVPGLGVLPFWYWLIAIFVIAVVHEFSHGILARAHNVEVKNTGIVLFGPILGAFVEPNEKKMAKQDDIKQHSILAAGAFSNILLALVALILLNAIFTPLQQTMVEPTGFTFNAHVPGDFPFAKAGITPGTLINGIDNVPITKFETLGDDLLCKKPGQKLTINTPTKNYTITLTANPDNQKKPFLGIQDIHNETKLKEKYTQGIWSAIYIILDWWNGFLRWLFLLSLGIGLFNLLPLPVVDGGRMVQVFLHQWRGKEKGEKTYRQVGLFFLMLLVINLLLPLVLKI